MLGAPGSETGDVPPGTYKVDLFAVLLCLLIAFVLNRGMRSAARFETWLVYLKVAIVLLVIVVGAFYIQAGNYVPFFPFGLGGRVRGRRDGVLRRVRLRRDEHRRGGVEGLPAAHAQGDPVLAGDLDGALRAGLPGADRHGELHATSTPRRRSRRRSPTSGCRCWAAVISVGAIVGILTVLFTFLLGASRVGYSMSRDGLLPGWLSHTLADDPRADPDHLDPRHRVRRSSPGSCRSARRRS